MKTFQSTHLGAGKEPQRKFIGSCLLKEDNVTVQHLSVDVPNTALDRVHSNMYIISMLRVFLMLPAESGQQQLDIRRGSNLASATWATDRLPKALWAAADSC